MRYFSLFLDNQSTMCHC